MKQWSSLLASLGFNASETKLYLTSLEMGPSPVQDIAKRIGVSRVTAYAAVESLIGDGLMSTVQKGKKTLYAAEAPERLLAFVQSRMKKMESTLREAKAMINELRLIQRGEKPVVKMFEGKEGLHAIHRDILASHPKEIHEFSNNDALLDLYDIKEFETNSAEAKKRNIRASVLALSTRVAPKADTPFDITLLDPKTTRFFGNVTIYGDKVALTSLQGNNISVLIESEVIAQTMREMFRLAKTGAKR